MKTIQIELTQGKYALIDEADLSLVSAYEWCACRYDGDLWYARSKKLIMHRLIMDPQPGEYVDHIDHNGLNNTRSNLRICTATQNQWNRRKLVIGQTRYKGVRRDRRVNLAPWEACIRINKRRVSLGTYGTEEEAARAYNAGALREFGSFACLNVIDGMSYEESITAPERPMHKPGPKKHLLVR